MIKNILLFIKRPGMYKHFFISVLLSHLGIRLTNKCVHVCEQMEGVERNKVIPSLLLLFHQLFVSMKENLIGEQMRFGILEKARSQVISANQNPIFVVLQNVIYLL